MTDLELTKKCAEKMGHEMLIGQNHEGLYWALDLSTYYDPLHDDAQAMALVKKFRMDLLNDNNNKWLVGIHTPCEYAATNADLNRAICECVAKLS